MRTRWTIAATLAAITLGATGGFAMAHATEPPAEAAAPARAPYCMVDREYAGDGFVTVAGRPGGYVTTPQGDAGTLTPVEGDYAEEVEPDAEPYSGILYNVTVERADTPVAVDGIICETT